MFLSTHPIQTDNITIMLKFKADPSTFLIIFIFIFMNNHIRKGSSSNIWKKYIY